MTANHELLTRLAGLQPSRPRRRVRLAQFTLGALVITTLGVAVPEARRGPQTDGSALTEVLSSGRRSEELRTITVGTHARLIFSKNISERVSVGSPDTVGLEVIGNRELTLLGREVGKTTLTVWFEDDTIEQFVFSVQRDLSVLDTALRQIHGNIVAEIAPDRDALVLTGVVPKQDLVVQAQQVAEKYLGTSNGDGEAGSIINLIRSGAGDTTIEYILQDSIHRDLGCTDVEVKRVSALRSFDEGDILVLSGTVPDQTKLTQVLTLASRLYLHQDLALRRRNGEIVRVTEMHPDGTTSVIESSPELGEEEFEVRVAADESGALLGTRNNNNAGQALGQLSRGTGFGGGGSSNFGSLLQNSIEQNIGRAKALELAGGRILSFLEVEDLPQVRVDIRLYEVNRNALLDWESQFNLQNTDYLVPSSINPTPPGSPLPTSNEDVRNLLGFLSGELTEQFSVSGNKLDLDTIFSVLETEGIAKVMSSPSITVLSGELASFGVGGQIPIDNTVFSGTGVATGSVTFVEFGVNLSVRPLIGENDFITLDVVPQISDPDAALTAQILESSGTNPPTTAFSQRVLRTTSRLRDGQALLIGGLSERSRRDDSGQTPWLHEIPVLGWLFKDFSYADSNRELVIVVHPVIVRDQPEEAQLWVYPEALELLGRSEAMRDENEPEVAANEEEAK
jgi:Flp pilus assembly secretin CpaC